MKFKFLAMMLFASSAFADTVVDMYRVDAAGSGAAIGQVSITETRYGLLFTPSLKGLPPGAHGFHGQQNPSCDALEKDVKMTASLAA